MAVQYQKQNQKQNYNPFQDDKDKKGTGQKQNKTSSYYIRMIIIVIFVSLVGFAAKGIYTSYETVSRVESYTYEREYDENISDVAPEGFLAESDLYLYDDVTGERTDETYTWSDFDNEYVTSKGIHAGDSWEDFKEVYGEYYIDNAVLKNPDYKSVSSQELTVNEFSEKYIDAGKIDPTEHGFNIEFRVYANGEDMAYSRYEGEYNDFFTDHDYDYESTYMEFHFMPNEDGTGSYLDYISTGYYE